MTERGIDRKCDREMGDLERERRVTERWMDREGETEGERDQG